MKHYLITLNGYGELLRKNFNSKSLFDYARKDNFNTIARRGEKGYIYLGKTLEKSYYSLFDEEKNFPGEAFVRFSALKIPHEKQTFFLARFLMQVDGRVIETDVNLSDKETAGLLDVFSAPGKEIEFYAMDREPIAGFRKEFPLEPVVFPDDLKGKRFAEYLYGNNELADINSLIDSSVKILSENPINRVREDLGEISANLLWLWGPGRDMKTPPFSGRVNRKTFYLVYEGKVLPLAELLGFEKISDIKAGADGSLMWINTSLKAEDGAAAWLRKFESFDRDILGKVSEEYIKGECRVLLIFDGFMSRDAGTRNSWGVVIAAAERPLFGFRLRRYFRHGRIVLGKFLG